MLISIVTSCQARENNQHNYYMRKSWKWEEIMHLRQHYHVTHL